MALIAVRRQLVHLGAPIGAMTERLGVQRNDPPTLSVSSLTRSSTTATVTTTVAHGYLSGDYVTIAGSLVTGYNAKWKIVTVPTATTFTFTCNGSLTTPATGTITVTYTSNGAGGQGANGSLWRTLDTVWAEEIPLSVDERLQLAAVQSDVRHRFRARARADWDATMQMLWTPSWPPGMARVTLAIKGILPHPNDRSFQMVDADEVPA